MSSIPKSMEKPHAVCIPYPSQGHVTPLLKLAKLLHHKGFHITFVNTEFNHKRLLRSRGAASLDGLPDFRFEAIPEGLPPSDADATQDVPSLCESTSKNCLEPFCGLIERLNDATGGPPVSCIVSDGVMSFTLKAAERFGLPDVLFWTTSACGFWGYVHYPALIERGYAPLKDMSQLTDGYLETTIDWIEGMNGVRLRDFPSFIKTTDPNDVMLNFMMNEAKRYSRGSALIINTFDALEPDVLNALSAQYSPVYTIGPLQLMLNRAELDINLKSIGSNLWREDRECIDWLDSKEVNSVVYVNFGSVTVMSAKHLTEFAWGLANSKKDFLWIIRPDLVVGDTAMLPAEFVEETKGRGMLAKWCAQDEVLSHPAVGGFLTHSGWNSTIESICGGVPVICWPFFAEQTTNCRYCSVEWGMGMEIDNDVKREEVERQVRELIDGEKGREMRRNAEEWRKRAEEATTPGGSSFINFEKMINEVLLAT